MCVWGISRRKTPTLLCLLISIVQGSLQIEKQQEQNVAFKCQILNLWLYFILEVDQMTTSNVNGVNQELSS